MSIARYSGKVIMKIGVFFRFCSREYMVPVELMVSWLLMMWPFLKENVQVSRELL